MRSDTSSETDILAFAESIAADRPGPAREYDQLPATPGTLARRIAFLAEHALARGRRVLCLGDDDFVSLLVARFLEPAGVTALDADTRVVEELASRARAHGLAVDAAVYDVAEPLPAAYRAAFDVCLTDPPYTQAGFAAFVTRGATALRWSPPGDIVAALAPSDVGPVGWQLCLGAAEAAGLVCRLVVDEFNEYDLFLRPWEAAAQPRRFTSSLLWFAKASPTRTAEDVHFDRKSLYAYEVR